MIPGFVPRKHIYGFMDSIGVGLKISTTPYLPYGMMNGSSESLRCQRECLVEYLKEQVLESQKSEADTPV